MQDFHDSVHDQRRLIDYFARNRRAMRGWKLLYVICNADGKISSRTSKNKRGGGL